MYVCLTRKTSSQKEEKNDFESEGRKERFRVRRKKRKKEQKEK